MAVTQLAAQQQAVQAALAVMQQADRAVAQMALLAALPAMPQALP